MYIFTAYSPSYLVSKLKKNNLHLYATLYYFQTAKGFKLNI